MYALIGNPLSHSFSADFFNEKFRREQIDEVYELCPLPSADCVFSLIESHPDLKGFNVTIPFKEKIIPFLDFISGEARRIGAVNVVRIRRLSGKTILEGFNTDVIGFKESIRPLLRQDMRKALVLGTGGASLAVDFALGSLGIAVTKVSRRQTPGSLTYDTLTDDIIKDRRIIVNATPLGTYPDTASYPPIPYEALTRSHLCYDLVYNPSVTSFMKMAASRGAIVKNGLEMLHRQAIAAWQIWNEPQ